MKTRLRKKLHSECLSLLDYVRIPGREKEGAKVWPSAAKFLAAHGWLTPKAKKPTKHATTLLVRTMFEAGLFITPKELHYMGPEQREEAALWVDAVLTEHPDVDNIRARWIEVLLKKPVRKGWSSSCGVLLQEWRQSNRRERIRQKKIRSTSVETEEAPK